MVRGALAANYAIRPLSAATVVPIQKPIEPVPSTTVELDKLYKRVELEMRGIDPAVLLSYTWFCVAAASHLGIEVTKRYVLRLFYVYLEFMLIVKRVIVVFSPNRYLVVTKQSEM